MNARPDSFDPDPDELIAMRVSDIYFGRHNKTDAQKDCETMSLGWVKREQCQIVNPYPYVLL